MSDSILEVSYKRFFCALLLLIVFAAGCVVWHGLHFDTPMTELAIASGATTFWGLIQLGHSIAKWGDEKGVERLAAWLLGKRRSVWYLSGGLFVLILLFLCTSSIHVEYKQHSKGLAKYDVVAKYADSSHLFLPSEALRVHSYERTKGSPIFFNWSPICLDFEVVNSPYFAKKRATLYPAGRIHITVPDGFERKSYNALLLVPSLRLERELPEPFGEPSVTYSVVVIQSGNRYTHPDFRKGWLVLGASEAVLKDLYDKEDAKILVDQAVNSHLDQYRGNDQIYARYRGVLEREPFFLETAEFESADFVKIEIYQSHPDHGSKLLAEGEAEISESEFTTLILDLK